MWRSLVYLAGVLTSLVAGSSFADNANMRLFPLTNYSQNVNKWLNPLVPEYDQRLLSSQYQAQRFSELKHTYFGTSSGDNSPWSSYYLQYLFQQQTESNNIANKVNNFILAYDNQLIADDNKKVYGLNFRPYPPAWIKQLQANIDLKALEQLSYAADKRAIATSNLALRSLPTTDAGYYSAAIAGQGFPFDNLQLSSIYAGTPLYILGSSRDKAWLLVLSPDLIGWVLASGVAKIDQQFISTWQSAAYHSLGGISQTDLSVVDQAGVYRFKAYVGMLFPQLSLDGPSVNILIPLRQADGMAAITTAQLLPTSIVTLPLAATSANFAKLFSVLQARAYGWGGLDFYNDCSAEMKAIYTLFGFYLPRNSQSQVLAGQTTDLSSANAQQRLAYLHSKAQPLFSLVKIKGHILIYVGSYQLANGQKIALSYQQMWGLAPKDRSYRALIGQAIFLPLLDSYAEDRRLRSELYNDQFIVINLKQFPPKKLKQGLNDLF